MVDNDLLKATIYGRGFKTVDEFCLAIGMNRVSFYNRLSGQTDWHCKDVDKIVVMLNMNDNEILRVFHKR